MWSNEKLDVETTTGLRKRAVIVEAYQVVVEPNTTKVEIASDLRLPATGSANPEVTSLFLKKRSFSRVSPVFWIVTMNYEGEFGPEGANSPPWASPPEISWGDAESDEGIDSDVDGNPIVTTAGEAIAGVTTKVADLVLNVTRNYQSFSPAATHQYRHSVNSDTFAGFAPGLGRLVRFSAKQGYDVDAGGYWTVNASIQFRYPYNTSSERAWYARVLNEGYYVKATASDDKTVLGIDNNKKDTTKPVLIKEDGTQEFDPENAHWLEFKIYTPLPYNALGLIN